MDQILMTVWSNIDDSMKIRARKNVNFEPLRSEKYRIDIFWQRKILLNLTEATISRKATHV